MMRSLFSGVSGLKVHQTKMDVIGNNIANVNTVGFKTSNVTFTDIFYQTTQSASGPNAETGAGGQNAKQIGLGSTLGVISQNITAQGGAQRTDNPFDMMINGDGFFVVNKGGQNYFTKAGNFTTDEAGTLVNGAGNTVMGWQADDDGTIIKDRVSALRIMAPENLTVAPTATTQSEASGNINKEDSAFANSEPINQYVPYSMKFFDGLGYEYEAMYHIKKLGDGVYSMNLYNITYDGKPVENLEAKKVDATATESAKYEYLEKPIYLRFNTTGETLKQRADGTIITDPNSTETVVTTVKAGGLIGIYDDITKVMTGTNGNGPAVAIPDLKESNGKTFTLPISTMKGIGADGNPTNTNAFPAGSDIEVSLAKITSYGSASTIKSEKGIDGIGKGKAVGKMSSIGIQTDGRVVANYSNGDTKVLGQIVVAKFNNPAGLEKVGENLFTTTLNSGEFDGVGEDITASGDKFSTGVLEMSNVDLSTEFTEMITTQRGFQANSRIITTSDTMLEELINLKR